MCESALRTQQLRDLAQYSQHKLIPGLCAQVTFSGSQSRLLKATRKWRSIKDGDMWVLQWLVLGTAQLHQQGTVER